MWNRAEQPSHKIHGRNENDDNDDDEYFQSDADRKKCIERVLLIFILHNRSWFFIRELIVCGG